MTAAPTPGHQRVRRAAAFALPFALVVYLALRGGGYASVVRGEVGLAVGWLLLLGAIVGLIPTGRIGRWGWIALGALGLLAAWTAVGIGWTESQEATIEELARLATFALVLAAVLSVQGDEGWRATLAGVAAAIAVVGVLALGSRLVPTLFPANEAARTLDVARARLNYPLNYWNGLAALLAIGLPLIAAFASEGRRAIAALASAVVPVLALACYFTLSRGGAVEVGVAFAVLLALHPARLATFVRLAPAALGSLVLIVLATQRTALENGLAGQAADDQRIEIAIAVVICIALTAIARVAIEPAADRLQRSGGLPSRRVGTLFASGAAIALLAVLLATGTVADGWEDFKSETGPGEVATRFESASGNGRYQYWSAAVDANATDPLVGTGPGTYRYYWSRAGSIRGVVHDAHSQYLQALGESGIVGLIILVVPIVSLLVLAGAWALRAPPPDRPWLAAATAGCAAFAVAAALDWVWQLTVVPVAFLCVVAALAGSDPPRDSRGPTARSRLAIGALGMIGALVVVAPLASDLLVESSQSAARDGDLPVALDRSQQAREIAPWAAGPRQQEALVLEAGGDLDGGADAAREATEREPTNWQPWVVLSRIEAERGNPAAARAAYERARSLNPRSPLLAKPPQ